MKFSLQFNLKNNSIPLDYRRKFLSFLKATMESYDKSLYEKYYNQSNTRKDFTFSVYMPNQTFNKESITIKGNRIYFNFSIYNSTEGLKIYTAIMSKVNCEFPLGKFNKMTLVDIQIKEEKNLIDNLVEFKLLSPLLVRDHNKETNKDWFYTHLDEGCEKRLKEIIKIQLNLIYGNKFDKEADQLRFDFSKCKKTVISNYNVKIPGVLGKFKIEGSSYILDYLYKAGIGSKSSAGFGMIDIV